MDKEKAQLAMQFMLRVQLTGQEVPAFNAVMQALEDIRAPEAPKQEQDARIGSTR